MHRGDEPQRDMQPRPASVLRVLLENHGKLVPRERLVQEVWGVEAVTDAAVDWVISELRRTFGASHNGRKLIFTSKKRGFRFEFPVERVSSDAPPAASPAPAPAAAPCALLPIAAPAVAPITVPTAALLTAESAWASPGFAPDTCKPYSRHDASSARNVSKSFPVPGSAMRLGPVGMVTQPAKPKDSNAITADDF